MNAIKLQNCKVLSKNDFAFLTKLLNRKDKNRREKRRRNRKVKGQKTFLSSSTFNFYFSVQVNKRIKS